MSHERQIFHVFNHPPSIGDEFEVSEASAHHLRDVLRLRSGDPVVVVDKSSGQLYECFVTSTASPFQVKISHERAAEFSPSAVSGLYFALCRGKINEYVAEKATELGVGFVVFWSAERSVMKLPSPSDVKAKQERLSRIAEAAAKQSGRNSIPEMILVLSLSEATSIYRERRTPQDRLFSGSLAPESKKLSELPPLITPAHCFIGPEGDFTTGEERSLREAGCELFSLGSNRLRAETAACAAVTALDIFADMSRGNTRAS